MQESFMFKNKGRTCSQQFSVNTIVTTNIMDERFVKFLNIYDEFKEGTALRDILNGAIRCYRHGIARPALMLSYIAFIQAVRNNLLNSEMPSGFKKARWDVCMNNLRNEGKWDSEVVDCIKKRANGADDPAFFELPDTLRDDVCFWRNRRNDCAHYKDSEITLSHVAAFWVFMMDNYNRFTPIGSLMQSVNDYKRHYNLSITPRDASSDKIFKRLCLAIKTEDDLLQFLRETDSCMQYEEQVQLLHDLLMNERHKDKVISLLIGKLKRVKMYLVLKPTDVSIILGNNPEMTRKFWYEDFLLFASCANVYVEMLRAKMIPQGEIKESLEMLLKHEYKRGAFNVDRSEDFNVLKENGLYDIFIEEYLSKDFVCNNPSEKCYKTDFYISLIHRGGISDKLIKALSDSVKGKFPYTLDTRLRNEIFNDEESKKQYFDSINKQDLDDFLHLA